MITLALFLLSLPYLFFMFLFGYALWHALRPYSGPKKQPKG